MEVIIQPDSSSGCALAASIIAQVIRMRPNPVLGLAAGRTPVPVYEALVTMHRNEGLSFRAVTTFNLDEYVGIPRNHPVSFYSFMKRHLLDWVDIDPTNTYSPDGMADDVPAACQAYERAIAARGGVDLQILGIGTDGHIGFNEPSSSLGSRTRIKSLTSETRRANAVDFGGTVPRHAITMGVGTILEAGTCLLLAFGQAKADAIAKTVEGPVTAMVPASALQFHPDARVILDPSSASLLKQSEYYRWVYQEKPDWQR